MVDKQPRVVEGGFRESVRNPKMLGKPKVLGKACLEKREKKSYLFWITQKSKQTYKLHNCTLVSYYTRDLDGAGVGGLCLTEGLIIPPVSLAWSKVSPPSRGWSLGQEIDPAQLEC